MSDLVACKHHIAPFNISSTAGFYSAGAGVMAGFAFLALFYLITITRREGSAGTYDQASQALGVAFTALLFSCISYAIVAGEPATDGRAASAEITAGSGFALATVQLFYSIVLLIAVHQGNDAVDSEYSLQRFFQVLGRIACALSFAMIAFGTTTYQEARGDSLGNVVHYVGWAILAALILVISYSLLSTRVRDKQYHPNFNPSYWVLLVGIIDIMTTSKIAAINNLCTTVSPYVIITVLALTGCVLAMQALWLSRPPTSFASFIWPAWVSRIRR